MGCCPTAMGGCSQESLFRSRAHQILRCLQGAYPSLFMTADFWRQSMPNDDANQYADESRQVWYRLGERIPVFFFEKQERFYQTDIGIINQRSKYLIVPEGMGLVAGDHVTVQGNTYFISEHEVQAGIEKLKVEREKSLFVMPARGVPTYRQFGARAYLV